MSGKLSQIGDVIMQLVMLCKLIANENVTKKIYTNNILGFAVFNLE